MLSYSQMSFEMMFEKYCLCDLSQLQTPFFMPEMSSTFANGPSVSTDLSLPSVDPEIKNLNIEAGTLTKEEVYFELLKGFKYKTIDYFDTKKQRDVPLYK